MDIPENTSQMEKEHAEAIEASFKKMDEDIASMKPVWPPIPKDSKAKAAWYDLVFAQLATGRSTHDVARDFGITVKQINLARGQRKRLERKTAEKQGSTHKKERKPTQRVATPSDEPVEETTLIKMPNMNSVHIDEALLRVSNVLNNVSHKDSTALKLAALMMVCEIITQANERVTVTEGLE